MFGNLYQNDETHIQAICLHNIVLL